MRSPFRLLDFLTFGLPAVGVTAVAVWVTAGAEGWEPKAVTWACAAGFALIYGLVVFFRWKASRKS